MRDLKVIAFTHKHIALKELGKFVICNETLGGRLQTVKLKYNITEIFYIGTCNRVEFVFTSSLDIGQKFVQDFIRTLNFCIPEENIEGFARQVSVYEAEEALNHGQKKRCLYSCNWSAKRVWSF